MTRRRGNGGGSIFRHERLDRWCAVVSVDGRRKYLYGRTRQEVAQKLAAALEAKPGAKSMSREGIAGVHPASSRL